MILKECPKAVPKPKIGRLSHTAYPRDQCNIKYSRHSHKPYPLGRQLKVWVIGVYGIVFGIRECIVQRLGKGSEKKNEWAKDARWAAFVRCNWQTATLLRASRLGEVEKTGMSENSPTMNPSQTKGLAGWDQGGTKLFFFSKFEWKFLQ